VCNKTRKKQKKKTEEREEREREWVEKSALTTSEGQVTRIESTHVILEAVRSKILTRLWRVFLLFEKNAIK